MDRINEFFRKGTYVGVHDRLRNLEARFDGVDRNWTALNDHLLQMIERNTILENKVAALEGRK